MGFFFSTTARLKKIKREAQPRVKQDIELLNRLGCKACTLNNLAVKTPKMAPTLANGPIYFLAEAPGKHEDETSGEPLTGPSGQLLRSCIPKELEHNCSFDNVINCRPPDNRTPTLLEVECCRSRRHKWIEQAKPKLIVGLGIVPLQWMLGSTDMSGMRGRLFAVKVGSHECWFMPTYHPSFILRVAFNKKKPLQSKMGHCFRMDVQKAFKQVGGLPKAKVDTEIEARAAIQCFDGSTGLPTLLGLLKRASEAALAAVDIETSTLRPYAAKALMLTAAISFKGAHFAFAIDHPKAKWRPEERKQILAALKAFIIGPTVKVAHNAPFELEWFIHYFGCEAVRHEVWECTMMQAHFIDERRGKQGTNDDTRRATYQSLDFLCKQHFGIAYKKMFKLPKKDMASADLTETLVYNGVDTKYTIRLFERQMAILREAGLVDAYTEALPRQPTVALMQYLGVDVDQAAIQASQKSLKKEIDGLTADIYGLKVVKAYIADHKEFNPLSSDNVVAIFKDYLNCTELEVEDKSGAKRYSVDKHVLDKIDHPLAELIVSLRNKTKMKSTYVDCFEAGVGSAIWPDKKLHTNFNTTFTTTGRLSCVAPWTKILTERGYLEIKDVVRGDWVWTHHNRWRRVKETWNKGWESMFAIKLSTGEVLTCTKKHRLLNTEGEWKTVGEIYGSFKEVDFNSSQYRESTGPISKQRDKVDCSNLQRDWHTDVQYMVGSKPSFATRREKNTEISKILTVQTRGQKSNEGQNWGSPPQLDWRMWGWLRLLNYSCKWRKIFCSSHGVYERTEYIKDTKGLGSPSHRWESSQQLKGQSGSGDLSRAQCYSLQGTGVQVIEIEEITPCGSCEVLDLTIEEDASYLSCGVFSHNSDEPNLQNFPHRTDPWVRKPIVPPPKHLLVAFDYGQLEACTSAMCSRDKVLVKALWEDYDIHMEWTEKLVKKYPLFLGSTESLKDKTVAKKYRSIVKNKLVFPAIFGASAKSIAGYLNSPEDVIEDLMDEFWATFDGLKQWQDRLMKRYYEDGFVESPTGRRHHYPLTRNEAINMPIQSFACDIVCDAMNRLSYMAVETGQWHLHPYLNVHDDLTFFIPDDDRVLEESIEQIYRVMLTPPFKCVNVPLSVSASVGKSWFEPEEIGKFWSNKDV